jgi:serine/threonine protein kinase
VGSGRGPSGRSTWSRRKPTIVPLAHSAKLYAMKIIFKDKAVTAKDKLHTFSERVILEVVDHPFIVKLHFAFQTHTKLYLLVDLMAGVVTF